jgi:hypothetical protein
MMATEEPQRIWIVTDPVLFGSVRVNVASALATIAQLEPWRQRAGDRAPAGGRDASAAPAELYVGWICRWMAAYYCSCTGGRMTNGSHCSSALCGS